jgi:SagB-type dehydrogenase family enzyme
VSVAASGGCPGELPAHRQDNAMTRFLRDTLSDLENGGANQATERLFAYHHATKHTFDSVRANAHFLDWRNQPNPFRSYEGVPVIPLAPDPGFPGIGAFAAMAALAERSRELNGRAPELTDGIQLDVTWLSRLLWHSMAVSAWKKIPRSAERYSLRVNPSSGNLHPTEAYLALGGFAGIGDGLYHYRADRHALEHLSRGNAIGEIARALDLPWAADARLIVGLTSIFWREAWKYRDRAYRYCCHDLGHAMMSLLLAARALGMSGGVVAHFTDLRAARALGLPKDSDEAPMAFLVFPQSAQRSRAPEAHLAPQERFSGVANELSEEEIPYHLLLGMHRSTILADPPGPLPRVAAVAPNNIERAADIALAPARDAALGSTVRRRRSALDFDADSAPMERGDFEQLLDFATRDWRADWRGNFDGPRASGGRSEPQMASRGADFVTLWLYVHRVRDCEQGVYRWDASMRTLERLHRGDVERVAAYLSLEQSLAGNACFAVSMIADLAGAAHTFGNRGYRYVLFEAGAIGQRLYVGAEALGWNATGIGAFYDDDVHRYLGLLDDAQSGQHIDPQNLPRQVIYHFSVGRAVPDPRLEG